MNKASIINTSEPTIYHECISQSVLTWLSYRIWHQRLRLIPQQSRYIVFIIVTLMHIKHTLLPYPRILLVSYSRGLKEGTMLKGWLLRNKWSKYGGKKKSKFTTAFNKPSTGNFRTGYEKITDTVKTQQFLEAILWPHCLQLGHSLHAGPQCI